MHRLLTFFLSLFTLVAFAQRTAPPDYARDWKQADSLAAKGLPKSALAIATRIYAEAKVQKNYPQVVKAAMHRMVFRSYADENAYVELVRSVKADINDTPEPARSILQSVLADIYWQYFQQNRYKFYSRATVNTEENQTSKSTDSTALDFRTWDARQLVEAATAAYLASVKSKQLLQTTPIGNFDVLLEKGDPSTRPLRPTLYDLLAHRALGFFQNTEPDLLKPIFRFNLDQPAYLATPDVFVTLPVQSQDSLSGRYQALRLYQQLLAFHLNDANPDALADVDALRLAFVYGHSVVTNRDLLYQQTLEKQINRYKNKPAEAVFAYQLAEFLVSHAETFRSPDEDEIYVAVPVEERANHWNRKQAVEICQDIAKRFLGTLSAQKANRLISELTKTDCSVQVESVTTPNEPFRALVTYQNTSKFLYRIIRISVNELHEYRYTINRNEDQRKSLLAAWLKQPKAAENTISLPDDGDKNRHAVEIPLMGLPTGQYLILTTTEDKLQTNLEAVQTAFFTVSMQSYLSTSTYTEEGAQVILVTDRVTGQPTKDVSISLVERDSKVIVKPTKLLTTNSDGRVEIPANLLSGTQYSYLLIRGQDTLLAAQQYYNRYGGQDPENTQTQTALFTDRAIYRPGQLIYVKGLVYVGKPNQYSISANDEVDVELLGNNGERIEKQTVTTNEFGTFTLTFTAPIGKLTGQMIIRTSHGATSVRVEEYKRPTFEVKAKPIRQSFKLGQTVSLTAEARTFSGAFLDKAAVRYRVTRKLRQRWYWWYRPGNTSQAEISNGTAQTDERGNVTIAFVATPDPEKDRRDKSTFDFDVTIDVTDSAGETRSTTKTLSIGYSALQAELSVASQLEKGDPTNFTISVKNPAGERVPAKGQLTVFKLQPPVRQLRNRLWSRPDRQFLSRSEFERLFPNDLYDNETDPRSWPKGETVQQQSLVFPNDSLLKPDLSRYPAGEYIAELTVTDSTGETTKDQAFFSLIDPKQPTASARPDGWLQVRKATVEPGENAIFWVGNSRPGWVLMTVEEKRAVVRQEWIKTNGRPQLVKLPVTEKQRGGFAVHFAMVQLGRIYQQLQTIIVPFTNKKLTIETQTFRNKLKPGEREEWTLQVSGLDKAPAEVVATLYDASLDVFSQLDWPTSFYQPYYPSFSEWQSNSFASTSSQALFWRNNYVPPIAERQYDQLSWLGYRFSSRGSRPFPYHPNGASIIPSNSLQVKVKRIGNTVSGTVRSKDGSPAAGVNVAQTGTSNGTSTDATGKFSFTVSPENKAVTLVFSYIGYATNEITLAKKELTFTLKPSVTELSEVVVVGYATQQRRDMTGAVSVRKAAPAPMQADAQAVKVENAVASEPTSTQKPTSQMPINPRRNFNETAFFMPQLKTDEQGRVVMKFTMPEALTRWRLLAFAHTKDLKIGTLEREIVTQKELMITANAPRFLREGDTIQIRARLTNLSDQPIYNAATNLLLSNALTGEPMSTPQRTAGDAFVMLAPGLSTSIGWSIVVPKGIETVTCRLTAQSGLFTDGEEFTIPVLPNRMLVTDTQPFWVNGRETKTFKLKELTNLNPELPVQHERLTVEVTSNPGWYALQSLPYLMEYRYECAEQLFSRLYANSLAAHIIGSKPIFKQVIAEWQKNPPRNPLEANEELRTVALENSPWLADARSEAERQAKLGQLLDANRMETEQLRAFEKLQQLQTPGGGFRWFGGMEPNLSITLHILSGFGHLQKLGVRFPDAIQTQLTAMMTSAVQYVDGELKRWVDEQKKYDEQKKKRIVGGWYFSAAQYFYARSFYLDKPMDKTVLAYVRQRVTNDWLDQSLQGQALSAMALSRFGDAKTANGILASLRERTRKSEEMGMYWPDNISGLFWYQTPIETQAYLIEAFSEVNPVQAEIDDMKRWLLRQKQTQSWSSTKATTEAVYALLLRGSDWLGTGVSTQVSLGDQPIENRVTKADAITGYEKVTYAATEIKPEMGVIQITKKADGPAWGALYWQHFEPLDQVMPGSAGLSVQKTLYVQRDSPSGPLITAVPPQTSLKPGDLIKVRLVLKTDRLMEYVHLKDSRASGFEPVAALSGYKYQNGLGYYEAPRDASTDFFMSYLPVGTHVFEYDLRVAQMGDFSTGVATVQCFYAPEFSAHSAGGRVNVK